MLFNSYEFVLIFLPIFLILFILVKEKSHNNKKLRSACKWLIVAGSLIFYVPFGWENVIALVFSIVLNYAAGLFLIRKKAEYERSIWGNEGDRFLHFVMFHNFVFAVLADIGLLLFFKFSGFFFPIAVSFYTFNQVSFIVDIYRGEIRKFSLVDYLCYILFFPKLLQGPLMGFYEFKDKLEEAIHGDGVFKGKQGRAEVILRGLFLFSMGLFKKVILADTFGKAVDYGFDNIAGLGSFEAILVAVFYSFQLYFDFSGYCDMAGAVCMLMGFDLPINFDSPYKAVNIIDFWKRWHISLTRFFTKYVYIPLGGNRKGDVRMYFNFMVVFLLSGLWHGSGWTFIVWGAMHGVLYVITRFAGEGKTSPDAKKDSTLKSNLGRVVKILLTFIYVTAAWIFFRAETVKDALALIARIFTGGHKHIATQLSSCFQLDEIWYVLKVTPIMKLSFAWESCLWLFLIAAVFIIFFSQNAITIAKKAKINVWTTLATAVLLLWSIVSFAGVSTFLYMNF